MKYVGIDVHKQLCQEAIISDDGELLDQIRFLSKKEEIKEFALKLTTYKDKVKAIVKSTGSLWIQRARLVSWILMREPQGETWRYPVGTQGLL